MIRPATQGDSEAIASIYNHYIEHTVVTFEEELVDGKEMFNRIQERQNGHHWVVATDTEESVVGYAYSGEWKSRCAYRQSAELTVYLKHDVVGKGIGTALYRHLLEELRQMNIHAVIGGVALPNVASVALHEKLGFQKVAHFKEVGYKHGRWIDVGYWELLMD